jgi:hypothetical protein
MAGSLMISEDAAWLPAGWVFDHVLDAVALKLQGSAPELALVLAGYRASAVDDGSGELDLRGWGCGELGALVRAVDAVHAGFRAAGPNGAYDRRFYAGLMSQVSELRAMLHSELADRRRDQAGEPSPYVVS